MRPRNERPKIARLRACNNCGKEIETMSRKFCESCHDRESAEHLENRARYMAGRKEALQAALAVALRKKKR